MKKQILIGMAILLISFASAYYPGEQIIIPNNMSIENLVYTIVGNSTPIQELDIEINSVNITITLPGDMPPNNFQIVFIEEQTKEIIKTVYTGGGSSGGSSGSTKYIYKNKTIEVPKFYDRNITETIELEKIIDNTTILETGYELWHIILAIILGGLFIIAATRLANNINDDDEEFDDE